MADNEVEDTSPVSEVRQDSQDRAEQSGAAEDEAVSASPKKDKAEADLAKSSGEAPDHGEATEVSEEAVRELPQRGG